MTVVRVVDLDIASALQQRYDVSLFASGYESRSIYAPGVFDPRRVVTPLVFGFTEERNIGLRPDNDVFFVERWKCEPILLSGDDEKPIYEYLTSCTQHITGRVHILVDYSSMSRLWHAAVLNWARFGMIGREVVIDFAYSMGMVCVLWGCFSALTACTPSPGNENG